VKTVSIFIGKALIAILRLSGRGGSALPGLVIEKIYPQLIERQLSLLSRGVVVVTGTNGKTTTTRALVHILRQSGLRVMTNHTGSNFTRGIYATIARYSSWGGGLNYDVAVLELEEAFSKLFPERYAPDYVLALNVMRDQLDRYGEIDTTASLIGATVSKAGKGVVLNADDSRVAGLASQSKAPVSYFSIRSSLKNQIPSDDDLHAHTPKHPKKSSRNKASTVTLHDYNKGHAVYAIGGKLYPVKLAVPGIHNALNIAAALALAQLVVPEMKPQFMVPVLTEITSAFGRGERIAFGDKELTLSLVKNPSGFRQALHSFTHETFDAALFVINDEYADGRDVSWLWDVDFRDVSSQSLYASGVRAYDMTLRLDYDDLKLQATEPSIDKMLTLLKDSPHQKIIIYCTYTAMLTIRRRLASGRGSLGDVW